MNLMYELVLLESCESKSVTELNPINPAPIDRSDGPICSAVIPTSHPEIQIKVAMASRSWPFCPQCRSTLSVDATGAIECRVCGFQSNLSSLPVLPSSTTTSSDRAVPMWAKSDEEQEALQRSKDPTRATVEEPCVKCDAKEVGFYTVQLRSVDEGQTVFYECPACKHTWSINN